VLPRTILSLKDSIHTIYIDGNPNLQKEGNNDTIGWRELGKAFGGGRLLVDPYIPTWAYTELFPK